MTAIPAASPWLPDPCAYCGTPTRGHREHVESRFRGGSDLVVNITHACIDCNLEKSYRNLDEWAADRVRVGLSWPPIGSTVLLDGLRQVLSDDEVDLINPVLSQLGPVVSDIYRAARHSTAFTYEAAAAELVKAARKAATAA